jgi:hypothetical protein
MTIINFIKSLFEKKAAAENVPGLHVDQKMIEDLEASSVKFGEIVSKANPVDWKPLDLSKLPDWPVLNQDRTSACVAFSFAMMCTIMYFIRQGVMVIFSPKWIYNWRKNKNVGDGQGMSGYDVFDIGADQGLIPEDMMPSQMLSEEEINKFSAQPWEKEVGKAFRTSDQRVTIPKGDIEAAASVMQTTGKPIMVWFNFGTGEWTTNPTISALSAPYNHSVLFVPPKKKGDMVFGIYAGKKAIVIQDSWGLIRTTLAGKRVIDEVFYKARNLFACYFMRFRFDEGQGARPVYDGSIISLQKCLQFEGCFPLNVAFAEAFGPVTSKSIAQFQLKHGLEQTGSMGPKTTALVKSLYS